MKTVRCGSWENSLVWLGLLEADILDCTSNCFLAYFVILAVCFNFGSFTIWHWSSNRTPHVAVLWLLKAWLENHCLPISTNFHFCQYNKQWIDNYESIVQSENQLCLAVTVRMWVTRHLDNNSTLTLVLPLYKNLEKAIRFLSLQLKIYSPASEVPAGTGGEARGGLVVDWAESSGCWICKGKIRGWKGVWCGGRASVCGFKQNIWSTWYGVLSVELPGDVTEQIGLFSEL